MATIPLELGTIAFDVSSTLVLQGPSTLSTIPAWPSNTSPVGFTSDHTKLICKSGAVVDVATMTYSYLPDTSPSGDWNGGITTYGVLPNSRLALFKSAWAGNTVPLYTVDVVTGVVAITPIDTRGSGSNVRFCYIDYTRNRIYVAYTAAPFIAVYDATTFALLPEVTPVLPNTTSWTYCMSVNPILPQVAIDATNSGRVYISDAATGADLYSVATSTGYETLVSYSADGTLFALTNSNFPLASRTRIYLSSTGVFQHNFAVSSNWAPQPAFTRRGTDLAGHGGPASSDADKVRDAKFSNTVQYTLAYSTAGKTITVPPPYIAAPITEPFWTNFAKTVETI